MGDELNLLAGMSDDVLECEIRGLSARVAATMCRFLLAVAEYDRRRAWERWECHDMSGWLSWKCGISPVTAREYLRVANALTELPLVRERFGAGALSYTQVRAITRCATEATEPMLVELAEVSTGAHLERITRAYRRCGVAAAEEEGKRDRGRYLRFTYDEDGCLVGSFRLPAAEGAALAAAIRDRAEHSAVNDADQDGADDPYSAVQADVLAQLVAAGYEAVQTGRKDGDDRFLVTIVAEAAAITPSATHDGVPRECHIDDGPSLSSETVRRIMCDCSTVQIIEDTDQSVLDVGRRTRRVNRPLRRALRRRDGGCRYPGCDRKGNEEPHHVIHWVDGGPTVLVNLISLCRRHHRRVHEGGYTVYATPDGGFRFVDPRGREITEKVARPVPELSGLGWDDPNAYRDGWDGSRLDLGLAVDGLVWADERAARASAEAPVGVVVST